MTIDAGTITLRFEYGNEEWANVINSGMGPTEVTGGVVHLPQGGTRQSRAAVTGGTFYEAAESGTGVFDEIQTMAQSLLPGLVFDAISGGINGAAERIKGLEEFMTNFGKSRLLVYAGEFSDNADEQAATNQIIDSFHAVLDSNISFDSLIEEIKSMIVSSLGE